jgi:hypothetical protein
MCCIAPMFIFHFSFALGQILDRSRDVSKRKRMLRQETIEAREKARQESAVK